MFANLQFVAYEAKEGKQHRAMRAPQFFLTKKHSSWWEP